MPNDKFSIDYFKNKPETDASIPRKLVFLNQQNIVHFGIIAYIGAKKVQEAVSVTHR